MTEVDPTEPEAPYQEHIGPRRQYIRDVILGVNDGLVSIFLLVAGVVGGGLNADQVLLTSVAGAIAGSISMAAGEYMATKSQEEVFEAEMALEKIHLRDHREYERRELHEMFGDLGVPADRLDELVEIIDSSDEAMMGVMGAIEFGIVDTEKRNPYLAAVFSGLLFILGSAPSILPFVFVDDTSLGLLLAGIFAGIALFVVGAGKTLLTRKNPFVSGIENLAIGLGGGVLSYAVGRLFDVAIF